MAQKLIVHTYFEFRWKMEKDTNLSQQYYDHLTFKDNTKLHKKTENQTTL